jgi:UDP:flavonoid glycosyltransferase YjiC (YdhE family)
LKIFMTSFGTMGDVRPMMLIAQRLIAGGDDVLFFGNPFFAERMARAGVPFRAVGEVIDPEDIVSNPRLRHPYLGTIRIWGEVFEPLLPLFYEAVLEEAEAGGAPDGIVNHPWCFGGGMAAEKLGLPWATMALAPVTWFSRDDPPMATAFEPPAWMHRWVVGAPLRAMINGTFQKGLGGFARAHGLARRPARYFWAMEGARMNLGMWSPAVRPPVGDDPPGAVTCGFPERYPPPTPPPLPPELDAFLGAGEPPLIMGLGSALPPLLPEVYAAVWEACESLGWRAALIGAPEGSVPAGDERLCVVPYASYAAAFPRARVVVHHGGIGSLADASAAGRPQLVLPQGTDQYDNAWRVRTLGVGDRCEKGKVTAARVARLLAAIDADAEVAARAEALAAAISQEEAGAEVAARAIREGFAQA